MVDEHPRQQTLGAPCSDNLGAVDKTAGPQRQRRNRSENRRISYSGEGIVSPALEKTNATIFLRKTDRSRGNCTPVKRSSIGPGQNEIESVVVNRPPDVCWNREF